MIRKSSLILALTLALLGWSGKAFAQRPTTATLSRDRATSAAKSVQAHTLTPAELRGLEPHMKKINDRFQQIFRGNGTPVERVAWDKELQQTSVILMSAPYNVDPRFNGFAKTLNSQFVEIESFLATQTDRSAIQKRVREISRTCAQCHDIYRPKKK